MTLPCARLMGHAPITQVALGSHAQGDVLTRVILGLCLVPVEVKRLINVQHRNNYNVFIGSSSQALHWTVDHALDDEHMRALKPQLPYTISNSVGTRRGSFFRKGCYDSFGVCARLIF